jgi:hypothetical protein
MGSLGPRRVKDIWRNWLQADTGNQGIAGTLVRVQDGAGTNTPIRLSTSVVAIDGDVTIDGTLTATTHTVTGITGNAGTATALQAGGADRIKLDGIATGATANQTDAYLLSRTNHTGSQAISTITALQAALDALAPKASPTFTGVPAAPTAAVGTNTTQLATTAYVRGEVNALIAAAPAALDTLDELAAALGDDANFAATLTTSLALKAPLASPTFTGIPAAPTAVAATSTTQLATTEFVTTADNLKANLASPTFTGTPAAPTASAATSTTQIATTAFVTTADNLKANLASPTFTGTPAAPTASAATSTTQIATTAFVTTADNLKANLASPTFTGTPAAPTAGTGTNTTQLATTAFVNASVTAGTASPTFTGTAAFANITTTGSAVVGDTTARNATGSIVPNLQANGTSGGGSSVLLSRYSADTNSPFVFLAHSRGASVGTHGLVSSGDTLGSADFLGSDGAAFFAAARVAAHVDGTAALNDMPGRLAFSTTASGGTTPTERMRIDNSGNVGIGTTSTTANRLRIAGNVTGGTTAYAVQANATIQSDVTSVSGCYVTAPATAATAFTLSDLRHFYATQGTIGAGSAVTNQFGFYAGSTLIGATNNYGFYSAMASGTGRYGFYAAGTAENYFNGLMTIPGSNRLNMGTDPGTIGASTLNPPRMTISGTSGTGNCNIALSNTSSSATATGEVWHAKSLAAGGTPTTTSGTLLGATRYYGHDSSVYGEAAVISASADALSSAGSTPGRLVFSTTAAAAVLATERMRITSAGYVQIGGTTANVAQVFIAHDSSAVPTAIILRDTLATGAADSGNALEFNFNDGTSNRSACNIKGLKENGISGNTASYLSFGTRVAGGGGISERLRIDSGGVVMVGQTSAATVNGATPAVQNSGNSASGSAHFQARFTADANSPVVYFGKSRHATVGSHTIVQSGDSLGSLWFTGSDGSAFIPAATITAQVDNTPGASDMPGRLVFATTADGAATSSERMRIDSEGVVLVGSTASRQVGGLAANLYGMQIEKAGLALVRNVASSSPSLFAMGKSRSATAGGVTIVQADDELARMEFCGADGVDVISPAARISVFSDGTPGSDDMPGRMLFYTTPDGSASPQERARITSTGLISLGGAYDAEGLRITQTASAVNRVEVTGAITTATPVLRSNGSDTNVALTVGTKGTGQISFSTNGAATEQARVAHVASAVNYILLQGSATGTPPIIQTGGSDTNRDIKISAAGTGVVDLGTTSATTASAGAQVLPANPAGFLNLKLNGSAIKVPYYSA